MHIGVKLTRGTLLVAQSCLALCDPWTVGHQASLSMGFSRQEYWSGLPSPSPIKKAECQRIDALEQWCWRRLLRVLWTTRKSNQSILKKIHPECSLERLTLKLKLQYFCLPDAKSGLIGKTLMLGKIEGKRRGQQRKK